MILVTLDKSSGCGIMFVRPSAPWILVGFHNGSWLAARSPGHGSRVSALPPAYHEKQMNTSRPDYPAVDLDTHFVGPSEYTLVHDQSLGEGTLERRGEQLFFHERQVILVQPQFGTAEEPSIAVLARRTGSNKPMNGACLDALIACPNLIPVSWDDPSGKFAILFLGSTYRDSLGNPIARFLFRAVPYTRWRRDRRGCLHYDAKGRWTWAPILLSSFVEATSYRLAVLANDP